MEPSENRDLIDPVTLDFRPRTLEEEERRRVAAVLERDLPGYELADDHEPALPPVIIVERRSISPSWAEMIDHFASTEFNGPEGTDPPLLEQSLLSEGADLRLYPVRVKRSPGDEDPVDEEAVDEDPVDAEPIPVIISMREGQERLVGFN